MNTLIFVSSTPSQAIQKHLQKERQYFCRKQTPLFGSAQERIRKHRITESQHGRGWQGPLWVTQPNPLPKQGHPEQGAQHRGQAGLEYLQRGRLHSPSGQPGPVLQDPKTREQFAPPFWSGQTVADIFCGYFTASFAFNLAGEE